MCNKWLSTLEIAQLMGKYKIQITRRANKENWTQKTVKTNGGLGYRFNLESLPEDIQTRWAEKHGNKGASPVKSKTRKVRRLDKIPAKQRNIGLLKEQLTHKLVEFMADGGSVKDFCDLYNRGEIHPELLEELGERKERTFYDWLRNYSIGGAAALAPKVDGYKKGPGGKTLTETDKTNVSALYLTQQRWSMSKCHLVFGHYYKKDVSIWTIRRYLNSLPKSIVTYLRYGIKKYKDQFEPYLERQYDMDSMHCIVGDHHMIDVMVKHKGKVFRPWVTVFTDLRSRKVLGWCVDKTPNTLTILKALDMVIINYGGPVIVLIDNGKDYTPRGQVLNFLKNRISLEGIRKKHFFLIIRANP